MKDKIYYASWGYDMTMNDYVKVLEENGKTAKVVIIGCRVENDNGMGSGRSYPNPDIIKSQPFRLRIRSYNNKPYLKGSYPFVDGSESKRMGMFTEYSGNGNYYNTWD